VLVPFAAGYYLSYLFRSINALIAGDLRAELGLSAADLGLLTSMYFLMFSAVVLPCGALLDRYGPRIVDSALFLVAATGALVFALADGVAMLLFGRALIGLGVAVGLIGGLKAIVMWFPPQQVALANGWYVMLGALGAVSATGPAELIVQSVGWRGLFAILAVASAGVALLILLIVPEKQAPAAGSSLKVGFSTIFRDARFWCIAPLGSTGAGMSWALQGLWAAPWLTDVAGLDRSAVVEHLTLMAAVLAASALVLGALAERLRRAGVSTEVFLAGTVCLSMAAQLALLLGIPVSSHLLFACTAVAGATPVLGFAILARYFPKEIAGRANAALGVLNMGTAFGLQCLSGFIIALWPAADGHYAAEAHEAAMATGLGLQLIALGLFLTPKRRPKEMPLAVAVTRALGLDSSVTAAMPAHYAAALSAWRHHVVHMRRRATAWRCTAVASTALCAALCASLFVALGRAPAEASAMTWAASIPATVPTASLLMLLAMLVMLTGCLVVSDRRFAARSLRTRCQYDLIGSQPPLRTAAAIQRPARPPEAPASKAPTGRAHRLSKQEGVARRDFPIATPAAPVSEATRRLDRHAGTITTRSAESVAPSRTAAQPNGTIRLRLSQARRVTRSRCRTRLVANAHGWAAPPDGTDTLIVTRAQHGRDEPSAAQPRPREVSPGSAAASGQTAPVPRVPPASTPPAQAEMRDRQEQPDAPNPDLVVRDNLGDPVPITAAEVDAIETYLGPKLRDLLADAAAQRKDKR
jgi:MFS family permease